MEVGNKLLGMVPEVIWELGMCYIIFMCVCRCVRFDNCVFLN
jgi:hypothetical protein